MKFINIDFMEKDFNNPKLYKRFLKHVVINGVDGCWEWTAKKDKKNYGSLYFKGKTVRSHRIAYLLANGPYSIPEGFVIQHACDNPACQNPDHLVAGTQLQNIQDRDNKGRGNFVKGENHYRAKLTKEQVLFIRSLKGSKINQMSLAYLYNVIQQHISDIQLGKRWQHLL